MTKVWRSVVLVSVLLVPAATRAQAELAVEGSGAEGVGGVSDSLLLPRPTGRTGSVVLVDRATLPSAVRERWWDTIGNMSKDGGFGRAARVIVDDPDPTGGERVCTADELADFQHAAAQVLICTELSMSPRGTGELTLMAVSRGEVGEAWRYARRSIPVSDFEFDEALAAAVKGFFVRTVASGSSPKELVRPLRLDDSLNSRSANPRASVTPGTVRAGAVGADARVDTADVEGSGAAAGDAPSVTAMLLVTALADDAFQASLEIGLEGPLSVVLTGGGQSQTVSGSELSSSLVGGAARAYFVSPMQGLYASAGLMLVDVTITNAFVDVSSSVTMFQPALGLKFTGSPGLAVGAELGLNVALSGETKFDDGDGGSIAAPRGTSSAYIDVGIGLSF